MKKSTCRRPGLERLEPMLPLSTLGRPEPARAVMTAAVVAPAPAHPITLTGALHATGQQHRATRIHGQAIPAYFAAMGSGNLAGIGHVKFIDTTSPIIPGPIVGLQARLGQLTLATLNDLSGTANTPTSPYSLIDGGGSIVPMVNPTGTISITQTALKGGKTAVDIKLS